MHSSFQKHIAFGFNGAFAVALTIVLKIQERELCNRSVRGSVLMRHMNAISPTSAVGERIAHVFDFGLIVFIFVGE